MFRITRQTDYAVRVVLALAQQPEGTRLTTGEIQESMQIPQAFLSRIVAQLSHMQLIRTFPGRKGGLTLARPADEITLHDVVVSIEGAITVSECIEGDNFCPFESHCPVRRRWGRLRAVIVNELSNTNFAMLAEEVSN